VGTTGPDIPLGSFADWPTFRCLVSGIKVLTIDLTFAKSLPAAAGIIRHSKTLEQLNVHASRIPEDCDDELVYDYLSFSQICKECTLLQQVSVAFPPVSVIRSKQDSFIDFEVSRITWDRVTAAAMLSRLGALRILTPTFTELPWRAATSCHSQHHQLAKQQPIVDQAASKSVRAPPAVARATRLRAICGPCLGPGASIQTCNHRVGLVR